MLNKILNNLKKPHLMPIKILEKIEHFFYKKKYNRKIYEEKQNNFFSNIELDRKLGTAKYEKIKKEFSFFDRGMSSEHEIIFSSLSIKHKYEKILEIGTYDGVNSLLLSKLFEKSTVTTIDISDKSEDFKTTYNREKDTDIFVKKRNEILSKNKNIIFREINSVKLINENSKYDLIWIDGAHGYPVVSMDIMNSLNLINQNGIIMCDDVFLSKPNKQDAFYNSIASYETLKALEKEKIIKLSLFYKRLDSDNNCNPKKRQFIALIKKIN